jgi:Fe-S cluster assembly protein SufB
MTSTFAYLSAQSPKSGTADIALDSVELASDKVFDHVGPPRDVFACAVEFVDPDVQVYKLLSNVPVITELALNAAVFTDGWFVYVPKGVRCPMELSTYFRINAANTGQFERTLIVADEGSYVSYLEGCTAPIRDENQLHAAVVELIALDKAQIKYSTVQNWYPRRQRRQRRDLQLRDEARQVPGRELEDFMDTSGDRLSHYLEVSELHPAG